MVQHTTFPLGHQPRWYLRNRNSLYVYCAPLWTWCNPCMFRVSLAYVNRKGVAAWLCRGAAICAVRSPPSRALAARESRHSDRLPPQQQLNASEQLHSTCSSSPTRCSSLRAAWAVQIPLLLLRHHLDIVSALPPRLRLRELPPRQNRLSHMLSYTTSISQ